MVHVSRRQTALGIAGLALAANKIKPDAASATGFAAYVVEDACRGINTMGSLAIAWDNTEKAGVKKIQSSDLAI